MSFTLSNLLQEAYRRLGQLQVSTATGGSTTTIVDSKLVNFHSDDEFGGKPGEDGAAFVIRDGAGSAPEGEFSRVSDYASSSGTFTLRDTLTAAVASGDRFGYVNNFYPLDEMVGIANTTLKSLGDVPQVDKTTLDTAADKTEYTVSVGWKRQPPYRIDWARESDSDDHQWEEVRDWDYEPALGGSTGLIVLPQLDGGNDLRIWYKGPHPDVYEHNDAIYEGWAPELVVLAMVEKALEWQNTRLQGGDDFLIQRLNDAKSQMAERRSDFPVWKPRRSSKLFLLDNSRNNYPGDRNPV